MTLRALRGHPDIQTLEQTSSVLFQSFLAALNPGQQYWWRICGINFPSLAKQTTLGSCLDQRFLRVTLFSSNYAFTRTYHYTNVSMEKCGQNKEAIENNARNSVHHHRDISPHKNCDMTTLSVASIERAILGFFSYKWMSKEVFSNNQNALD